MSRELRDCAAQCYEWKTEDSGRFAQDSLVWFILSICKMKWRQMGMVYCCTNSFVRKISERFSFVQKNL